jgi:predicted Zn-ribbon and HTH transcriptional regulator
VSTYYESCCDRLPGDCICEADRARCLDCGEGYLSEQLINERCPDCAHDAVEASREEETQC